MTQGVGDAVTVDCGGDKIGCGLHIGEGVAHSHSDAGMAQQGQGVASLAPGTGEQYGAAQVGHSFSKTWMRNWTRQSSSISLHNLSTPLFGVFQQ